MFSGGARGGEIKSFFFVVAAYFSAAEIIRNILPPIFGSHRGVLLKRFLFQNSSLFSIVVYYSILLFSNFITHIKLIRILVFHSVTAKTNFYLLNAEQLMQRSRLSGGKISNLNKRGQGGGG